MPSERQRWKMEHKARILDSLADQAAAAWDEDVEALGDQDPNHPSWLGWLDATSEVTAELRRRAIRAQRAPSSDKAR